MTVDIQLCHEFFENIFTYSFFLLHTTAIFNVHNFCLFFYIYENQYPIIEHPFNFENVNDIFRVR